MRDFARAVGIVWFRASPIAIARVGLNCAQGAELRCPRRATVDLASSSVVSYTWRCGSISGELGEAR